MPIMVIKVPTEDPGLPFAKFVESCMSHREFTRNRANGKALAGIRSALANIKDGTMRVAAEPDYAVLRVIVDKPEHTQVAMGPDGKPVASYAEGYQFTAAALSVVLPYADAIMDATEETAEEAKAESAPAPAQLASVP